MRPDDNELEDEIRGHLALSVRERIERGEDPEAARCAALREFGNVTSTRESMRDVWRPEWVAMAGALGQEMRFALRSLRHAKGMAAAVVVTLALGIGANAAVYSVVRQVLLTPLVNRDEDRLIYIRQSAPGHGTVNSTFSIPEIRDLQIRTTTVSAFGEFSTIDFTMIGFGEPRVVNAGLVSGSYFEVIGLRPAIGRLLTAADDGPDASPAAVLTHRFWSSSFDRDPTVVGRTIRLGTRAAKIIGVLEPSVAYPVDTEIIANVVTSPHHLGATMVTERTHRMTELFGRLAPGATLEAARADLVAAHAAIRQEHPGAYPPSAGMQLSVTRLRDQITAPARPVLLVLLAAAALVFAIACSNVANLILARSVRRERELAVRAALGASAAALRRTLLAESLLLCGGGAALGVLLAPPLVTLISRYAARFSVRALDVMVDASVLWVGAALAMAAAVALAYVPRLPAQHAPVVSASWRWRSRRPAAGGVRITPATDRRLRLFAVAQIGLSFVLLAGAGMVLAAFVALRTIETGYNARQVLAVDVPIPIERQGLKTIDFLQDATRRVARLPGVQQVAIGNFVPWRDADFLLPPIPFAVDGYAPASREEAPHARLRNVTPGFFAALGIPLIAGRAFTDDDHADGEPVVIVSESVARRAFPNGQAIGRRMWWTHPLFGKPMPRRIVGIAADADDQSLVPQPALTIYHPFAQMPFGDRLFVQTSGDPYALVPAVTSIIKNLAADQPVERPATLADVRADVLAPERLNALVFSAFAGVSLMIAVVGVAGVLAFSVSARTREFGVRLAVGSTRWRLLTDVLSQGAVIAAAGIASGALLGFALLRAASLYVDHVRLPGAVPLICAASVLVSAAVLASLMPAARASRVDVMQALRSE